MNQQGYNISILGADISGTASCAYKWSGGISGLDQWPAGNSAVQEVILDFMGRWNETKTVFKTVLLQIGLHRVVGSGRFYVYGVTTDAEGVTNEFSPPANVPNPPPPGDHNHRKIRVVGPPPA
jgi:hypothetical protein